MIAENSTKTARGRPFPKGVSGNPGGRPKSNPEAKEYMKGHELTAAMVLVDVMLNSKNEKNRIWAATELLDRTQGKPETMSKVQLSTGEESKIVFQWIGQGKSSEIEGTGRDEKCQAE